LLAATPTRRTSAVSAKGTLFVPFNRSQLTARRLKRAIERPLEVALSSKGDGVTTELCVTAPMDAAGFARPRVLLGALSSLGFICPHPLTTPLRCHRCASLAGGHGVQGTQRSTRLSVFGTHSPTQADIHSARRPGKALQEVHRFLLTDLVGQPIVGAALRSNLVKMVRCLAVATAGYASRAVLRRCALASLTSIVVPSQLNI